MKILVTGGAGYIGSHTCVALAKAGHKLIIIGSYQGIVNQPAPVKLIDKETNFHHIGTFK